MSLNGLTVSAGLKLVPLVLETLVKHYVERLKATPRASATTSSDGVIHDGKHGGSVLDVNLRKEDLLYDQTFTVAKEFVSTASRHTIEEMQQFARTKTPSPPWVRVSRVLVPMSCCDQAAEHLIDVLGGGSAVKEVLGGTKWWQVRDVDGVDAEWIVAKKDWQEVEKRAKSKERRDQSKERREKERGKSSQQFPTTDSAPVEDTPEPNHTPDMDEQRCILYLHGGAYYFGSVDQERYSIQRFARDINGRAFAINYRLSPQYPFPCAIQDALAAYLYLIRPPLEAKHKPVKPQHIVIVGNSAGGGLSLALLQVIRDSGLPPCAGGVLISPWCDARHSFPSVYTNAETDFLPYHCLAMHKPSILWPPPTNAESDTVRQSIRSRLRRVTEDQGRLKSFLGSRGRASPPKDETITSENFADTGASGAPTSVSSVIRGQNQRIVLELDSGETLDVDTQIHFYAPNNLLSHPLISPCGAYLGGLPPLLFTAGNQEVLRDEIVYTAHRAADPSKFPIPAASRRLYPRMTDIEARHPTPTKVHLQVYDGCAHILPILFVLTTPAKHCFRAIASFCRFATGMEFPSPGLPSPTAADGSTSPHQRSFFGGSFTSPPEEVRDPLTESRGRSWWGEGKSSLMSRSDSGTGKADKEKSKGKATKENREIFKGENRSGECEIEEVNVEANGEGSEDVQKGSTDHPGPRKVGKDDTKAEAVGKVGVVDVGSPPFGEDRMGNVRMVDKQLKAEAEDDTARSLGDAKSFRSLISRKSTNKSQGGTKPGKGRLSLAIARGSAPENIPAPSKELTNHVAESQFEVVREPERQRRTGDYPSIYVGGFVGTNFIRERVSIRGVTRPLEPEAELPAFQLKADLIGAVSELPLRRYIEAKAEYEVRFSDTLKSIVKERERNLKLAHEEDDRSLGHLESYLQKVTEKSERGQNVLDSPRLQKITADNWNWSWAMDEDEDPPPSSLVSRRDTWEARQLATIADIMPEGTLGNLWQHLVTFLTVTPDEVELPAEREHPKPEVGGQRESDWTGVLAPLQVNTEVKAVAEDSPTQTCSYVYPF